MTLSQIIFAVYIPFITALVSLSVPLVGILLSVFSQGREEVSRTYIEAIGKITLDIKANPISKKNSTFALIGELMKKNYTLLLLNPNAYLFLLVPLPVLAIVFALLGLHHSPVLYLSVSALFIALFFILLWSLINVIAEITAVRESKREEYDRAVLETLQGVLKNSDPTAQQVTSAQFLINDTAVTDGMTLPSVVLGKEFSWKVCFSNGKEIPAKRVELGIQFPFGLFEIKKQSGYSLYEPENIARYNDEYIQKNTNRFFLPPLIVTPTRTGTHEVTVWLKGENVVTKYFNLQLTVEIEA